MHTLYEVCPFERIPYVTGTVCKSALLLHTTGPYGVLLVCHFIDLLEHCSVRRLTRTPHYVPRPAGARRRYEPKSRPPAELPLPDRRHAAAIL